MVFWGSLGLILGALGAFLGGLLVFLLAFGGTLHVQNFFLGSLHGQIYCFCSSLLSLLSYQSLFSLSWSLFVSILSSQADPPTLKNVGFMRAGARFSSDLKMLLTVFWGSLELILGALGAFLGALLVLLRAFGGTLHAQNFFLGSLPGQIYCFYRLFFRSFLRSLCFPSLRAAS